MNVSYSKLLKLEQWNFIICFTHSPHPRCCITKIGSKHEFVKSSDSITVHSNTLWWIVSATSHIKLNKVLHQVFRSNTSCFWLPASHWQTMRQCYPLPSAGTNDYRLSCWLSSLLVSVVVSWKFRVPQKRAMSCTNQQPLTYTLQSERQENLMD